MSAARAVVPGIPPLGHADVLVWRARLGLDDAAEAAVGRLLSAEERERAERFRQPDDRRRFLVGRGLLRALLGEYAGFDPRRIRFSVGAYGKPGFAADLPSPELEFNVSHSGDLVLVALTRGRRVGVDVERLDRRTIPDGIASRFFSPPEVAALRALPPARRTGLFLRLWVMKEAFAKGIGAGIGAVELNGFAVDPDAVGGPRMEALTPPAGEAIRGWFLMELPAMDPYVAALAVEGAGSRVRVFDWPALHLTR